MKSPALLTDLLVNLGRYVCPLYVRGTTRHGEPTTPFLVGTGTLFHDGQDAFIVTATHVLEEAGDGDLLVGGAHSFIIFRGERLSVASSPEGDVDFDISVFKLNPLLVHELRGFYLFSMPQVLTSAGGTDSLRVFAFVGYPHSKNKPKSPGVKMLEAKPFFYVLKKTFDVSTLNRQNKRPFAHLAWLGPIEKAITVELKQQRPPSPKGISGCGVWEINVNTRTGLVESFNLIGIGTEYFLKEGVFVATKIGVAVFAMRSLKDDA